MSNIINGTLKSSTDSATNKRPHERMRCGVCNVQYPELYCPHCVNYFLLRPKLDYLATLQESYDLKATINKALQNCIKGENYKFIAAYIASGGQVSGTDASVAALASQLLTIDTLILKRRNNKITREIEAIKMKKQQQLRKIEALRNLIEEKNLLKNKARTFRDYKAEVKTLQYDNSKIVKQLGISKSLLFQELIGLYGLKKRKLTGRDHKFVYMLAFAPILSLWNLLEFSTEVINTSLSKTAKFLTQVGKVLLLPLPFDITCQNEVYSIAGFELFVKTSILEMSTFELRLFSNAFVRLIGNAYVILQELELIEEGLTYQQMVKLDELVYKLGNYDHSLIREGEEPVKSVDIDQLNSVFYRQLQRQLDKKSNEWHVVDKDTLNWNE